MLDTGNAGPTIIEDYWARKLGLTQALDKGVPRGETKVSEATVGLGPIQLSGELVSYIRPGGARLRVQPRLCRRVRPTPALAVPIDL